MATTAPPLPREVVAIDGKMVRRSFDRGRAQGPLHVISAFATAQGLSLGQVGVIGKGQELAATPVLISGLQLANTIVTVDALGCQRTIGKHQKVWGSRGQQLLRLTWEALLVGEDHDSINPCLNC